MARAGWTTMRTTAVGPNPSTSRRENYAKQRSIRLGQHHPRIHKSDSGAGPALPYIKPDCSVDAGAGAADLIGTPGRVRVDMARAGLGGNSDGDSGGYSGSGSGSGGSGSGSSPPRSEDFLSDGSGSSDGAEQLPLILLPIQHHRWDTVVDLIPDGDRALVEDVVELFYYASDMSYDWEGSYHHPLMVFVFNMVARLYDGLNGLQIRTAFCIGTGTFDENWPHRMRGLWQLTLFRYFLRAMYLQRPDVKLTIYAQEPRYSRADKLFLDLLGVTVLDADSADNSAAALFHGDVDAEESAFLFAPFLQSSVLVPEFLVRPAGAYFVPAIPALYVGTDVAEIAMPPTSGRDDADADADPDGWRTASRKRRKDKRHRARQRADVDLGSSSSGTDAGEALAPVVARADLDSPFETAEEAAALVVRDWAAGRAWTRRYGANNPILSSGIWDNLTVLTEKLPELEFHQTALAGLVWSTFECD